MRFCSRFTCHLLTKAKHVTAVDFMENFVEKNRQNNGHHSNASFIQADVTKLDLPKNRCVLRHCPGLHLMDANPGTVTDSLVSNEFIRQDGIKVPGLQYKSVHSFLIQF